MREELMERVMADFAVTCNSVRTGGVRKPGNRFIDKPSNRSTVREVGDYFFIAMDKGLVMERQSAAQQERVMKAVVPAWVLWWLGRVFVQWIWSTYYRQWEFGGKVMVSNERPRTRD